MSIGAACILILFYIYHVEPRRRRDRDKQLELLREILRAQVITAEKSAKIAEATETINLTVWDHWQWIRGRTS